MANRTKTERNNQILALYHKQGWKQQSIANMLKMKLGAVNMVIVRDRKKNGQASPEAGS